MPRQSNCKDPKNPKQVSIVIVNWNSALDTITCIESLQRCSYVDFDLIVVDNGSQPEDVNLLEERCGRCVKIIRNETNLGFAGGVNKGIATALKNDSPFILLLNNDTVVDPEFLEILISHMVADPEIGIATPKINYYSAPAKIWSAGGYISKLRASGFSYGEGRGEAKFSLPRTVTFASGCCMLIRTEMLKKVGLFDENYFLYLEDSDFCYRVVHHGYKILYVPESRIFHKVNMTSKKKSAVLPLYYTTRNRLYFARKFLGNMFFLSAAYLMVTLLGKSIIWLIKGELNNLGAVQRAFFDFLKKKFGKAEYF
ncbi:MAG: glycosyltransferase family 2 protein [candidate division WOR-3 bacterium]